MSAAFDADLPCREKFVLVCLGDHAREDGSHAFPSVRRIGRMCGLSESTIKRTLASLLKKGVIVIQAAATHNRPTVYRLIIDGLAAAPEPSKKTVCPTRLRAQVIEAFNQHCSHCGHAGDAENGPDGKAWHIDRIIPGARGGEYVPVNVTLSCGPCNLGRRKRLTIPATSLADVTDKRVHDEPPLRVQSEPPSGFEWVQIEPIGGSNQADQGVQRRRVLDPSVDPSKDPSGTPSAPPTAQQPKDLTPQAQLVARHQRAFAHYFGAQPRTVRGHYVMAATLIERFGFDRACALDDAFFVSKDKFIHESDHGFDVFYRFVDKLVVEQANRPLPSSDANVVRRQIRDANVAHVAAGFDDVEFIGMDDHDHDGLKH